MKKCLLLLAMIVFATSSYAQKEKRVYYLDVTKSMDTPNFGGSPKFWNAVKDNLKDAIEDIEDATTEIEVYTFTDKILGKVGGRTFSASDEDKKELLRAIDSTNTAPGGTNIEKTFEHFYSNHCSSLNNTITYLFIMTDGKSANMPKLLDCIKTWKKSTENNIYGFYVMLKDEAKDSLISKEINDQERLWKVETANVNINLIRLEDVVYFNVRDKKNYVDVPIYGKLNNVKLTAQGSSRNYKSTGSDIVNKGQHLRVFMDPPKDLANAPEVEDCIVSVSCLAGPYDILLTTAAKIICENKKIKSVNPILQ